VQAALKLVQAALKLVLEPIFEADFQSCSYGFRPNRRAHDAIAEIHHFTSKSYQWVLEADIEACFDMIDHTALMDRLRARISDKRVLALVKAFLKAGVLTTVGTTEGTITGTPQGGILSPLLANIALSILDDEFARRWAQEMGTPSQRIRRRYHGEATYRLIRYADDFVIVVKGERTDAEQLRQEVADVLAPMGLRLSPEKTRVVHIDDGFDFLGFNIRRMRKRGSHKSYVYTRPSTKAIASIKARVPTINVRLRDGRKLEFVQGSEPAFVDIEVVLASPILERATPHQALGDPVTGELVEGELVLMDLRAA